MIAYCSKYLQKKDLMDISQDDAIEVSKHQPRGFPNGCLSAVPDVSQATERGRERIRFAFLRLSADKLCFICTSRDEDCLFFGRATIAGGEV